MSMNLNQLYQLKHDITLNKGGTVNKTTVLAIIDSHISLLQGQEDITTQSGEQGGRGAHRSCQGAEGVGYQKGIEQVRSPPSMDQVRKAYNV